MSSTSKFGLAVALGAVIIGVAIALASQWFSSWFEVFKNATFIKAAMLSLTLGIGVALVGKVIVQVSTIEPNKRRGRFIMITGVVLATIGALGIVFAR